MASKGNDAFVAKGKETIVRKGNVGIWGIEKKAHWSDDDKRIFLDICIEQFRQGRRQNTSFDKYGWREIAKSFNKKNNTNWEIEKFKSLYRNMRGSWLAWKHLCQKSNGWGWCQETQSVDPPSKEHWNHFIKEEVVRKTQSFERLKVEAEKCLAQTERCNSEKTEFESAIYAKFVGVLNSKKAKLRELRDQLSKQETTSKPPQEEDESTDKTESYDEGSDDDKNEEEPSKSPPGTSKNVPMTSDDKSGEEPLKGPSGTLKNVKATRSYSRKRNTCK